MIVLVLASMSPAIACLAGSSVQKPGEEISSSIRLGHNVSDAANGLSQQIKWRKKGAGRRHAAKKLLQTRKLPL